MLVTTFPYRASPYWQTQKPRIRRSQFEIDPNGKLGSSLLMAFAPVDVVGRGGMFDFANPDITFTATGTINYANTQRGVGVNSGFTGTAGLTLSRILTLNSSNYSVSFLANYDGLAHSNFAVILLVDSGGFNDALNFGPSNTLFNVNGQAQSTLDAGTLTGWHRVGITVNGVAVRYFLDGKFHDTANQTGTFGGSQIGAIVGDPNNASNTWGLPVADIFVWNRTLSDADMGHHFISPYGTVLRQKASFELPLAASAQARVIFDRPQIQIWNN